MTDGEDVGGVVPGATSTDSGRANETGTPNGGFVTGRRPSGVDCRELFVPAWEDVEAGLFRDEEVLAVEAEVEVIMNCFDGSRANEPCGDGTRERRGRSSPLRTGEAWMEIVGEFMIGNGDLASVGGVGGGGGGGGRHVFGSKRRERCVQQMQLRVGGLKEEEAELSETYLSLPVFTAASWDTVGRTSGLTMGASSAKGTAENNAAQTVS
jgi:hypothetical protein